MILKIKLGVTFLNSRMIRNIFRRVESQENRHKLQVDLNNLVKWAKKWQMLFNNDKCKYLHIGQANVEMNYLMNKTVLLSTEREKM